MSNVQTKQHETQKHRISPKKCRALRSRNMTNTDDKAQRPSQREEKKRKLSVNDIITRKMHIIVLRLFCLPVCRLPMFSRSHSSSAMLCLCVCVLVKNANISLLSTFDLNRTADHMNLHYIMENTPTDFRQCTSFAILVSRRRSPIRQPDEINKAKSNNKKLS